MYTYSIIPLKPEFEEFFDEICADLRMQYENGIATCILFNMTLVPEERPPVDKVGPLCRLYRKFKAELSKHGVNTGVLVQASLGHGYELQPNPFQRYVNLTDGREEFVCCPEDESFLDHFSDVLSQISAEHPDAIMLDDDFRLAVRPGRGCACPRHLRELKRRTGIDITREELYKHLTTHPDNDPLTLAFLDMQRDSLIKAARRFRDAIDSVDPTIQGINCTSGDACDSVAYTSRIFAGKGNPSIVRVPNGTYAPLTARRFSETMRSAAVRSAKLKKRGVDILIAETDTVPFNRYGKNARYLHSHYVASMLDGFKGAKHWLTRTSTYEPASGKEFRRILAQHRGMYEALADMVEGMRPVGCGSYFKEREYPSYLNQNFTVSNESEWVCSVIERLGLPFYFTDKNNGAAFLEGNIVRDMTDGEIEELFAEGSVFLDSNAAVSVAERGFGHLIGVRLDPWDSGRISGEFYAGKEYLVSQKQKNAKKIVLTDGRTEVLSENFDKRGGEHMVLSAAVTCLERGDGLISVVFCGSPKANFHYTEGFSFLNETRKRQLVELLLRAYVLPVYYPGDAEICMRAGYLTDGRLLVVIWNLGFDPLESLPLCITKQIKRASVMLPDGSLKEVKTQHGCDAILDFAVRAEPMYPVVFVIEQ